MKKFFVYIMTNTSRTLYTGVTSNPERHIFEHKYKTVPGFTSRYNITKSVYYEELPDAISAIALEKEIKGWSRAKHIKLITDFNPTWKDLAKDWFIGR